MAVEDYTTYTEVDVGADRITFTGTDHIDFASERNEEVYLYDDKGVGHFDDFEHLVDVESDFDETYCLPYIWIVTNGINDAYGLQGDNEEHMAVRLYENNGTEQIVLINYDGAALTNDPYACLANTPYYLTIERNDATGTVKIYTDDARTVLVDTLTLAVESDNYRYIYACANFNNAQANRGCACVIENLDLQEGGVEPHGPADDANANDDVTFDVEEHMADDANASDANTFDATKALSDTAKASDSASFQMLREHNLGDTAKASDNVSFQMFHAHNIGDTAKASDALTFDAEINLADIAKASDLYSDDSPPPPVTEYPCPTFTLNGTSTAILFPKPEWANPKNGISKNISLFNFKSGDLDTVDRGIGTQPLTIGGTVFICAEEADWCNNAAMTVWLDSIKTAMNNGETFTINELGDCLNGVYVIKNFAFNTIKGIPDAFTWTLSLERVMDV